MLVKYLPQILLNKLPFDCWERISIFSDYDTIRLILERKLKTILMTRRLKLQILDKIRSMNDESII